MLEQNEKVFKQLGVDRIKEFYIEDYCAENSYYPYGICSTCSLCLRTCDRQLHKSLSIIQSSCVWDIIALNVFHNLIESKATFVDLFFVSTFVLNDTADFSGSTALVYFTDVIQFSRRLCCFRVLVLQLHLLRMVWIMDSLFLK